MLLAWIVALSRLRHAIVERQVFGIEASMAFLVAVLLPFMRAQRVVAAVSEPVIALRRAISARRGAESDGPTHPGPLSRNRADRSLQ